MAQSYRASSNRPLDTTLEFRGLVELCGQIEEVHFGRRAFSVRYDDERVDFEVCELAVDVDSVQSCDKVNENIVDTFWNFFQQRACDLFVGWVF